MINKIFGFFGYTKDAATQRSKNGWFVDFVNGGGRTIAGEYINNDNSLNLSTVFACINNISTDVAKVPIKVFQNQGGRRVELTEHPLRRILDKQANKEMSAMAYRQATTAHMLGWGNSYSQIVRNTDGSVAGLYPFCPNAVELRREDGSDRLFYRVTSDAGNQIDIWAEDVLHVYGLGFDGLVGYNVIHRARESMGLALATEKFGASYFGNGTVPGGFIEHPDQISEKAIKSLTKSLEGRFKGAEKAHRIAVLEEGMKFTQNTIPPEESQFLETRQFSIPEICRWFRMQPHKVADLSRATFSNIEEQSLEYVTDTLTPWFRRWEQAIWMKLLTEEEKQNGVYVEHVAEGLLRGNIQARYNAYQIAIGNNNNPGFMTVNEIRNIENLNPVDGGDELFTPSVDQSDTMIEDVSARIAKREAREIAEAKEKHGDSFNAEIFNEKFIPRQCEYIKKVTKPLGIEFEASDLIGKTQEDIKEILCMTKYSAV